MTEILSYVTMTLFSQMLSCLELIFEIEENLNNLRMQEEILQCIQHLSDGSVPLSRERPSLLLTRQFLFSPSSGYPLYFHLL